MKFSLSWLKAHLATEAAAAEIGERLTMIGHELEALTDRAAPLRDFLVGEIVACARHPDAEKLNVCVVDTGTKRLQVVCGAPNARQGLKGVFAAVGTTIPATGQVLKPASIRGVESAGMLLSEREMGLSDAHDGIVELAPDALVGAPAAVVLGLDDPLFEVAVTPNRADCLGVRGLARDLAAAGLGKLKPLPVVPAAAPFASPIGVRLAFPDAAPLPCPYFLGRLIRGVRNGDSPGWLRERLHAAGLRPISALVDITNYLTLDLCRPLHVFDAAKLAGGLTVRLAEPGERLAALDGNVYDLSPEMTVIADATGPQALGGVIGGAASGCTRDTTEVFVEAALFDPGRTARTGRRLNILSDARFRFERGLDPAFVRDGLELATRMILDLCGGEASAIVAAGAPPPPPPPIRLRAARVAALTGVAVAADEQARILADLGFGVAPAAGDGFEVRPPSWRIDIVSEGCLVEEVIRIAGYERIPVTPLTRPTPLPEPVLTPLQRRRSHARRSLAAQGLIEAVTFSFVAPADAAAFGGGGAALTLINPISADLAVMRPSLLPGLLAAVARNADRGQRDVALFEVGPQYAGDRPEEQTTVAAGVRAGRAAPVHWADRGRPVDAFDAKADALALLAALGQATDKLQVAADAAPAWYHPVRSALLRLGPKLVLAAFGEIHPRIAAGYGIKGRVVAFEVFLDRLPERRASGTLKPPADLPALQPVERDFAFVVDAGVAAATLLTAAQRADPALISDVVLFDVFTGEAVGAGRKSLAITVTLQPRERTLTEAEIEAVSRRIVERVGEATGGSLRA